MLLCGVYARSEITYGNIDIARKIFDMALSYTDGLLPVRIKVSSYLILWNYLRNIRVFSVWVSL